MGLEYLQVQIEQQIATITLQRPPANALSQWMLRELSSAMDDIEANDQISRIVAMSFCEPRSCIGRLSS